MALTPGDIMIRTDVNAYPELVGKSAIFLGRRGNKMLAKFQHTGYELAYPENIFHELFRLEGEETEWL